MLTVRLNRIIFVLVRNGSYKNERRVKVNNLKITLEAARVNAGMTQKQVAEKLGKTVQTIVAWEKEPYKISIKTAYELADLYSTDINNLIFMPE